MHRWLQAFLLGFILLLGMLFGWFAEYTSTSPKETITKMLISMVSFMITWVVLGSIRR